MRTIEIYKKENFSFFCTLPLGNAVTIIITRSLMYHFCSICEESCDLKNLIDEDGRVSRDIVLEWCADCGDGLDITYSIIIQKLRRQKLLPNDFKTFCCECYVEEHTEDSLVQTF